MTIKHIFSFILLLSSLAVNPSLSQKNLIKVWQYNNHGFADSISLDTGWVSMHRYNPIYFESPSSIFLGSLGSATINTSYQKRQYHNFFFLNPYQPYIHTPENQIYYNTKKPFTEFKFSNSNGTRSKLEETLNILHIQNINPFFNAGFDYDMLYDKGQYTPDPGNRNSVRSKINSISLFSNYCKERLHFFTGLHYNKIGPFDEYGGVLEDTLITKYIEETQFIQGRLKNASTKLRNRNFHALLEYKFDNLFSIKKSNLRNDTTPIYDSTFLSVNKSLPYGIAFFTSLNDNYRVYKDNENTDFYYKNFYLNPQKSFDSTGLFSFKNSLILKKYQDTSDLFKIQAAISFNTEYVRYNYNIPTDTQVVYKPDTRIEKDNQIIVFHNNDTAFNNLRQQSFFNTSVSPDFEMAIDKKTKLFFNAHYYLSGYKKNDFSMILSIKRKQYVYGKKVLIEGGVSTKNETPDFFLRNYFSNHYAWNNTFSKQGERNIYAVIVDSSNVFNARFDLIHIRNYTYLGLHVVPEVFPDLYITSGLINVNLKVGLFHFDNKILLQKTSAPDSVLSLPAFSILQSTYFKTNIVTNVLDLAIGFDLYYDSKFFSPAYDASVGQFYTQIEKRLGNYPFFDIFATAKWKRTRLFAKYEHINSGLQYFSREFFSALHYPRNIRMLKVGIAWNFYD